ncbi:HD domain-containing protein [Syntrophomonas wolfei]|uniref:Metal dependent phosphohydrolase n=1 Tax=Syntrophomonas wolfei subsp. wolfei (strain DSM 2245B / Goettingen) TaxID=335541 RepID=Q0AX21_SYNWW|nr:HD domain-containing protein [Syntrophomonas wolfei]ABI68733.1 metal dependent phosphohydrolase [Syntrophomonas wolfei subsp. wolfei str. Goettingen G311]
MVTLKDVRSSPLINTFIQKGNEHLGVMGYTDHGRLHLSIVSALSKDIMIKLGYDEHMAELAGIAGYIHDIGNVINRIGHSQSGALMAMEILRRMGMPPEEVAIITAAIGNHDEGSGHPVNEVAAALILADKSHVHRNRVRNPDVATFDIHDRVNYAVERSTLNIDENKKVITMELVIDTSICPVMEYFEIFMSRMLLCRRAAGFLGCEFELVINGVQLL